MKPESSFLSWHLQARFLTPETVEAASFSSRQEAVEHAQALLRDYCSNVSLVLLGPGGTTELLHEGSFMAGNSVQ